MFGARAGCGDVTSLYKNLVKNRKTNLRRQAIQEPIFSVANTDFEGGCNGRGGGCGTFLVICAPPSHIPPPPNYYACALPSAAFYQCLEPCALRSPRRSLKSYWYNMLKRVLRDAFPADGSPLLSHCSTFSQQTHPHLPLELFLGPKAHMSRRRNLKYYPSDLARFCCKLFYR
jgi:hypothetical protein